MKKILALALALMMVLALCACGGNSAPAEAPAPAEDAAPAPAAEEAPAVDEAGGDASGEMGASGEMADASGEMGGDASGEMTGDASAEDSGPVSQFDVIVNAPVIGEGASALSAVGGDASKVVIEPCWTGANGDQVTLDSGTFAAGEYTLSITFKAAAGAELADPVNVKFVGSVGTEYQAVSSNGSGVYEMNDVLTIAAGEGSGEPS